MKTPLFVSLALALLTLFAAPAILAQESLVSAQMAGKWAGQADVIVSWCAQTKLPVSLSIGRDGKVAGTVGDAVLRDGRLKTNRGALGRMLNIKTDYIITGKLTGPIVASEGITRAAVKMPVNFAVDAYSGGLHTSGSRGGGKKFMKLSAGLRLTRATITK